MEKKIGVQYTLRWRLVCNRWRLVGNPWWLVGNRWRLVGSHQTSESGCHSKKKKGERPYGTPCPAMYLADGAPTRRRTLRAAVLQRHTGGLDSPHAMAAAERCGPALLCTAAAGLSHALSSGAAAQEGHPGCSHLRPRQALAGQGTVVSWSSSFQHRAFTSSWKHQGIYMSKLQRQTRRMQHSCFTGQTMAGLP